MSESSTFENRMAAYQDRQAAYKDKVLNFEERTQQYKDEVIAQGKQIATEATAPLIAKITEVGIQKLREGKKAVETAVKKATSTAKDAVKETTGTAEETVGETEATGDFEPPGGFIRGARSLVNRTTTEASETMQDLRGRLRAAASKARDFAREKLSRPNRVREQNRPDPEDEAGPAEEDDDDDDADFEDAVEDPETDLPDPAADFEQVGSTDVPDQSAIDDGVGDIAEYFRQVREAQAAESAASDPVAAGNTPLSMNDQLKEFQAREAAEKASSEPGAAAEEPAAAAAADADDEPSAFDAFTSRLQTRVSRIDPRARGDFGELDDLEGDDFSPLSQTIFNAPEVRNAVSVTHDAYEPADDALQSGVRSLQQRLGGNSAEEEGMEMNSMLGSEQNPIQMEPLGELQEQPAAPEEAPTEAPATEAPAPSASSDAAEGARVESQQSANITEVQSETGASRAAASEAVADGSTATEGGSFIGGEGEETIAEATAASEGLGDAGAAAGAAGGEIAGEVAGEEAGELVASAIPGVGEIAVGLIAIGSLLGGIFGGQKPEPPPPPVKLAQMAAPRFQGGLRGD